MRLCGGVEASPCTHEHDDACGFVEAVEGAPCTFVHEHETEGENACGYDAETGEGCTYDPASHTHDESCGYVAAVEGPPCGHEHDTECGYAEAVEAVPCTHACELCAPVLPPDNSPLMVPAALNGAVPMALPVAGVGDVHDGVNMTDLMNGSIYYGTYNHYNGSSYDATAAPILWEVMGEDAATGNMAALSTYVLDSRQFDSTNKGYQVSDIKAWLESTFAAAGNFPGAEQTFAVNTTVTTGLYDWSNGDLYPNATLGGVAYDGSSMSTGDTGQRFYLPWGTFANSWGDGNSNKIGWAVWEIKTKPVWWITGRSLTKAAVPLWVGGCGRLALCSPTSCCLSTRPAMSPTPMSSTPWEFVPLFNLIRNLSSLHLLS